MALELSGDETDEGKHSRNGFTPDPNVLPHPISMVSAFTAADKLGLCFATGSLLAQLDLGLLEQVLVFSFSGVSAMLQTWLLEARRNNSSWHRLFTHPDAQRSLRQLLLDRVQQFCEDNQEQTIFWSGLWNTMTHSRSTWLTKLASVLEEQYGGGDGSTSWCYPFAGAMDYDTLRRHYQEEVPELKAGVPVPAGSLHFDNRLFYVHCAYEKHAAVCALSNDCRPPRVISDTFPVVLPCPTPDRVRELSRVAAREYWTVMAAAIAPLREAFEPVVSNLATKVIRDERMNVARENHKRVQDYARSIHVIPPSAPVDTLEPKHWTNVRIQSSLGHDPIPVSLLNNAFMEYRISQTMNAFTNRVCGQWKDPTVVLRSGDHEVDEEKQRQATGIPDSRSAKLARDAFHRKRVPSGSANVCQQLLLTDAFSGTTTAIERVEPGAQYHAVEDIVTLCGPPDARDEHIRAYRGCVVAMMESSPVAIEAAEEENSSDSDTESTTDEAKAKLDERRLFQSDVARTQEEMDRLLGGTFDFAPSKLPMTVLRNQSKYTRRNNVSLSRVKLHDIDLYLAALQQDAAATGFSSMNTNDIKRCVRLGYLAAVQAWHTSSTLVGFETTRKLDTSPFVEDVAVREWTDRVFREKHGLR